MNTARDTGATGPVSEIAIVDTFTKLIFGEEGGFSGGEELIIQAFRLVDHSIARDGYREMGAYLRTLEVTEMVQLVTRVQVCLVDGLDALTRMRKETVLNRRAH
jgi:hypothetical protein